MSPAPREFYRQWVINALRALGPSSPTQVYDWIGENEPVLSAYLSGTTSDGENLFEKTIRWARKDLYDDGVILSPKYGVWSLAT